MWLHGYRRNATAKGARAQPPGRADLLSSRAPHQSTDLPSRYGTEPAQSCGFLLSAANMIAIKDQFFCFDSCPSFLFVPFRCTAAQLWAWAGEPVDFLVVCDAWSCSASISYQNFSLHDYVRCSDPDVSRACDVFAEVLAVALGAALHQPDRSAPCAGALRKAGRIRAALRAAGMFQAPAVPAGCSKYIRLVRMGRQPPLGRRRYYRCAEEWLQAGCRAHPAPDPVNLMCRSLDAFSVHLQQLGELRGMGHAPRKPPWRRVFPTCLDGGRSKGARGAEDCYLCLASSMFYG